MERGRIPPVERKKKGRRKNAKKERKKERHPNKEALELIERGYKSEHKSLTPKKTLCVTAREGLCEEAAQSGGGESVFLGRVDGGLRGVRGVQTHRPLC